MRLIFSPAIQQVMNLIRFKLKPDQSLYIVGGALRDILLGKEPHDLDFLFSENPADLAREIAHALNAGFFVLDDERNTARVIYQRYGNKPFCLDFVKFTGDDLISDLKNRDFTINAIAVSFDKPGKLIDPLGGIKDLANGLIRVCSEGSLMSDPVRVLRGIRLAGQLGFCFAPDVPELMRQASKNLTITSYERQRDEFFKILEGPEPAKGLAQCRSFNIFDTLIPPLVAQEEIPASPPHMLPLFDHTIKVVEYCNLILEVLQPSSYESKFEDFWVSLLNSKLGRFSLQIQNYFDEQITPGRTKKGLFLFSALLHDIGKPETLSYGEDGHLHFYNHAEIGAALAWDAARKLHLSNDESTWVQKVVRSHMDLLPFINQHKVFTRREIYHFFKNAGDAGAAIATLCLADTLGTYLNALTPEKWEQAVGVSEKIYSAWFENKSTVVFPKLLLNGNDLQEVFGLKPGKIIGDLLEDLEEEQASGEVQTQAEAEAFLNRKLKRLNGSP